MLAPSDRRSVVKYPNNWLNRLENGSMDLFGSGDHGGTLNLARRCYYPLKIKLIISSCKVTSSDEDGRLC